MMAPRGQAGAAKAGRSADIDGKSRTASGKRQTIYLSYEQVAWLYGQADRQDRSISWIVGKAIDLTKDQIERFPSGDGQLPRGSNGMGR